MEKTRKTYDMMDIEESKEFASELCDSLKTYVYCVHKTTESTNNTIKIVLSNDNQIKLFIRPTVVCITSNEAVIWTFSDINFTDNSELEAILIDILFILAESMDCYEATGRDNDFFERTSTISALKNLLNTGEDKTATTKRKIDITDDAEMKAFIEEARIVEDMDAVILDHVAHQDDDILYDITREVDRGIIHNKALEVDRWGKRVVIIARRENNHIYVFAGSGGKRALASYYEAFDLNKYTMNTVLKFIDMFLHPEGEQKDGDVVRIKTYIQKYDGITIPYHGDDFYVYKNGETNVERTTISTEALRDFLSCYLYNNRVDLAK